MENNTEEKGISEGFKSHHNDSSEEERIKDNITDNYSSLQRIKIADILTDDVAYAPETIDRYLANRMRRITFNKYLDMVIDYYKMAHHYEIIGEIEDALDYYMRALTIMEIDIGFNLASKKRGIKGIPIFDYLITDFYDFYIRYKNTLCLENVSESYRRKLLRFVGFVDCTENEDYGDYREV